MIVVSNSSPLISLARIDQLALLQELFGRILIAAEVHEEIVVRGAGRPAADLVSRVNWIEVQPPADPDVLDRLRKQHSLGAGELATVVLATSRRADLVIMDDRAARRLAQARGLAVMGCLGILETAHRRSLVADLRDCYRRLMAAGMHIDRQLLNQSLQTLGLDTI